MRIEDATQTVGGHPVRIYATDGPKEYPIHGAIFREGAWHVVCWTIDGSYMTGWKTEFDLDLYDWRDEIPWGCLRDEIKWVKRTLTGLWWGIEETCVRFFDMGKESPDSSPDAWGCRYIYHDLSVIKMPEGPEGLREVIARRPET